MNPLFLNPAAQRKSESLLLRYGVAVLAPLLAILFIHTRPVLMDCAYFPFLGAIMISALFGGVVPGFLSTGLSLLSIRLLFIQPPLLLAGAEDTERLLWFALLGLISSSLIAACREARNLLRESEERHRILAESACDAIDAIILVDHNEEILFMNQGAEALTLWLSRWENGRANFGLTAPEGGLACSIVGIEGVCRFTSKSCPCRSFAPANEWSGMPG